jgi:hypothetical protein
MWKKLFEREVMTIDRYIELTSKLGVKKLKKSPSKGLEEEVTKLSRGKSISS